MMKDRYLNTATEVLIVAMETLGEAEENQVIVLMRTSNGDVSTVSNLNYYTDRIGLLQSQLMWEAASMVKTETGQ